MLTLCMQYSICLEVGMPLQRRSPQDRAPLWSQE
uniref:DNA binding / catalytic/ nuclease n=1 Tax=Arundo donax TaxID=35708 RepID=A0A0A9H9P4_ARUDO